MFRREYAASWLINWSWRSGALRNSMHRQSRLSLHGAHMIQLLHELARLYQHLFTQFDNQVTFFSHWDKAG